MNFPLQISSWRPMRRQCPGRLLGTIGLNPSVSKSNRLHVVVFWFRSINLRYIPHIPLKGSVIFSLKSWPSNGNFSNRLHVVVFRICFNDLRCIPHIPLKGSITFPKVLTFKCLFLKPITCCRLSVSFHWFEVHSTHSSKRIDSFPKVLTFKWLCFKQIGSTVNLAVCPPHLLIRGSMVLKDNFNVNITLVNFMVVLGGPKHLTKLFGQNPSLMSKLHNAMLKFSRDAHVFGDCLVCVAPCQIVEPPATARAMPPDSLSPHQHNKFWPP